MERKNTVSKMNWSKINQHRASFDPRRQLALKLNRQEKVPATEPQKSYMRSLGIEYPKNITKRQAMGVISNFIEQRKRLEEQTRLAMELAMARDG